MKSWLPWPSITQSQARAEGFPATAILGDSMTQARAATERWLDLERGEPRREVS